MFCLRCFSKLGDSATESGSSCPLGHADDLCDFTQAEAENVMEHDRLTLLDRQRGDRHQ
jgi:hypothetical protein